MRMRVRFHGNRRVDAQSAALGARWCYFILKAAVLTVILIRDGDLLQDLHTDLGSAVVFFLFVALSTILYLSLVGWVRPEDESVLLGARERNSRNIPLDRIIRPAEVASDTTAVHPTATPHDGDAVPSIPADDQASHRNDTAGACSICEVRQLVRTKHCRDCGRCVYTFDHHCFWIGTCVGEGNRRLFWWYLLCELITVSWASSHASSAFHLDPGPQWLELWLGQNVAALGAFLVSLGFTLLLGGLFFFHTYLICTGQTSWEVTRRNSIDYMRSVPVGVYPFSQGCWKNTALICLRRKGAPPHEWPRPAEPWQDIQHFWWLENEYWSCF